jgi:hypothetical protein
MGWPSAPAMKKTGTLRSASRAAAAEAFAERSARAWGANAREKVKAAAARSAARAPVLCLANIGPLFRGHP